MTPKILIISAPSGGGKTTVMNRLKEIYNITPLVGCTTRQPRPNEVDGQDYNFVTVQDFVKKIEEGYFIEYENIGGSYYGTPKDTLYPLIKNMVLPIDVKGAINIKHILGNLTTTIFLYTRIEVLRQRLVDRGTESIEQIEKRMSRVELELGHSKDFDYVINNYDLDTTIKQISFILENEGYAKK